MFKVLLMVLCVAGCSTQMAFLDQVEKDRAAGAEWRYVGPQPTDPTAKAALPIIPPAPGFDFILWKLFF